MRFWPIEETHIDVGAGLVASMGIEVASVPSADMPNGQRWRVGELVVYLGYRARNAVHGFLGAPRMRGVDPLPAGIFGELDGVEQSPTVGGPDAHRTQTLGRLFHGLLDIGRTPMLEGVGSHGTRRKGMLVVGGLVFDFSR
jgi:hypothetical protein